MGGFLQLALAPLRPLSEEAAGSSDRREYLLSTALIEGALFSENGIPSLRRWAQRLALCWRPAETQETTTAAAAAAATCRVRLELWTTSGGRGPSKKLARCGAPSSQRQRSAFATYALQETPSAMTFVELGGACIHDHDDDEEDHARRKSPSSRGFGRSNPPLLLLGFISGHFRIYGHSGLLLAFFPSLELLRPQPQNLAHPALYPHSVNILSGVGGQEALLSRPTPSTQSALSVDGSDPLARVTLMTVVFGTGPPDSSGKTDLALSTTFSASRHLVGFLSLDTLEQALVAAPPPHSVESASPLLLPMEYAVVSAELPAMPPSLLRSLHALHIFPLAHYTSAIAPAWCLDGLTPRHISPEAPPPLLARLPAVLGFRAAPSRHCRLTHINDFERYRMESLRSWYARLQLSGASVGRPHEAAQLKSETVLEDQNGGLLDKWRNPGIRHLLKRRPRFRNGATARQAPEQCLREPIVVEGQTTTDKNSGSLVTNALQDNKTGLLLQLGIIAVSPDSGLSQHLLTLTCVEQDECSAEAREWKKRLQVLSEVPNRFSWRLSLSMRTSFKLTNVLPWNSVSTAHTLGQHVHTMENTNVEGGTCSPYSTDVLSMGDSDNKATQSVLQNKGLSSVGVLPLLYKRVDPGRSFRKSIPCPYAPSLTLALDTFGRAMLICTVSLRILHLWKGYRDAQAAWILLDPTIDVSVPVDESTSPKASNLAALGLFLHAPRLGILELWSVARLKRLSVLKVSPGSVLVSAQVQDSLGFGRLRHCSPFSKRLSALTQPYLLIPDQPSPMSLSILTQKE